MKPLAHVAAWACSVALLAGCAASKPKPQPLEPLTPKISAQLVWSKRIEGGVQFPLGIATGLGAFTVATSDGTVVALSGENGQELWRGTAGTKLSAGVGSDGRHAAVVTRDGELVVFEQGQPRWRKSVGSRIATAPLVAGDRVFVLGIDRSVHAFDAATGDRLWSLQRPGDPLTLSQAGVLAPFKDTLIVGQGPRMVGIEPLRGAIRWEVPVGSPRGANEIERLADLVGPAQRAGNAICARSFQAAVGCVDAERGALVWTKNVGGTDGIAADDDYVFGADATDRMTAWRTPNGEVVWTSDKLQYRSLSAPAILDKNVVFGDGDGTLHWLSRETGEAQLRTPTDGSPIVAMSVDQAGTLLVVTRNGGLFAFRAS